MILTKIATNKTVSFFLFDENQEEEYFNEVCPLCQDADCNDNCIVPFPINGIECYDCNGKGRLKFLVQPADLGESYWVITACGICDGVGLL